jgi:hypothetical protein
MKMPPLVMNSPYLLQCQNLLENEAVLSLGSGAQEVLLRRYE